MSSFQAVFGDSKQIVAAGAHNGLTARLAERAGFNAIWASGLEISASHGVPDANILSFGETLSAVQSIVSNVKIPVIVDGDSGYGNAINVIDVVRRLERSGVKGLCLEDNVFPKRNSFYEGVDRDLVPIEEHIGKIKAAKYARENSDFFLIARTEALIANLGIDAALDRAYSYADAGADAILIHSKKREGDEILEFASRWSSNTPLVCVPTTYFHVKATDLFSAGYSLVIYANHGIRSAVKSIQSHYERILRDGSTELIEDELCSLKDLFGLVDFELMKEHEALFVK